jgi:hypothetical protein
MPLAETGVHTVRVGNVGALATDRILETDTWLTADEHVLSEILSFHPESDGSSGSRAGAQILNERISKFDSVTSVLGRTRFAVTDVDRRTGNVSLATAFGNTGNKRPSNSIAFVVNKQFDGSGLAFGLHKVPSRGSTNKSRKIDNGRAGRLAENCITLMRQMLQLLQQNPV